MEPRKIKTVLVGVGGYGASYLSYFADGVLDWNRISLEGVVDPFTEGSTYYPLLREMKVPIYAELADFYRDNEAELAVISTPVHLHRGQCEIALGHGSHVLCEKPLAPCLGDWRELRQAERVSCKRIGVGFQWSFSRTMLALKEDILSGRMGRPVCLKSLVCWPRGDGYYSGSSWKGRLRDREGRLINDSIVSNATAHYLHNMVFLLGSAMDSSLLPATVSAELYRVKEIETFDTCFLKGKFTSGAGFYFVASHAGAVEEQPVFSYEFENAVVGFNDRLKDNRVRARFADGSEKVYGDPFTSAEAARKLEVMLDHAGSGCMIPCGLEAVLPHAYACDALAKIPVMMFPDEMKDKNESGVFCPALDGALHACYDGAALPSELAYPWAAEPSKITFTR